MLVHVVLWLDLVHWLVLGQDTLLSQCLLPPRCTVHLVLSEFNAEGPGKKIYTFFDLGNASKTSISCSAFSYFA